MTVTEQLKPRRISEQESPGASVLGGSWVVIYKGSFKGPFKGIYRDSIMV